MYSHDVKRSQQRKDTAERHQREQNFRDDGIEAARIPIIPQLNERRDSHDNRPDERKQSLNAYCIHNSP